MHKARLKKLLGWHGECARTVQCKGVFYLQDIPCNLDAKYLGMCWVMHFACRPKAKIVDETPGDASTSAGRNKLCHNQIEFHAQGAPALHFLLEVDAAR